MSFMGISDWRAKKQMKYPERGTLRVTGFNGQHSSSSPSGARITGVITAPGVPATTVEHKTDEKDRWAGVQELPVLVDRADPTRFTILWEEVQAAQFNAGSYQNDPSVSTSAAAVGPDGQPLPPQAGPGAQSPLSRVFGQGGAGVFGQMISQAVGDALGEAVQGSVRRATEDALGPFGGRPLGRKAGRTAGRVFGGVLGQAGDAVLGQRGGQSYGVPGGQAYGQPGQPGYGQPGQPVTPGQPGQPGQPDYGPPGAQPFNQPGQQPFGQPGQQPFGQPGQQPFGQPGQQPFGQPTPPPAAPPGGATFGGAPFGQQGSAFPQVSWSDQAQAPAAQAAGPQAGADPAEAAQFFASGGGEHASAVVMGVRDVPPGPGFAPPAGMADLTLEITRADGSVYTAPARLSFATPERRAAVATPGTRLRVRIDPNLPTRVAIVS